MKKILLTPGGLKLVDAPEKPNPDWQKYQNDSKLWNDDWDSYTQALQKAVDEAVPFKDQNTAISILFNSIMGGIVHGELYDVPNGYRVIHEMTEGWMPSYYNPDNAGCEQEAEPTGFVLLVPTKEKVLEPLTKQEPESTYPGYPAEGTPEFNKMIFIDGDFNDSYESRVRRSKGKGKSGDDNPVPENTMPKHSERDWTEDFKHENGNYTNKCIECTLYFYGHKRRVICKKCSTPDWHELAKKKRPEDTKDNNAGRL